MIIDRITGFESLAGGSLHRWRLLRLPGGRALYLHRFRCSDARSPHDHPKRFVTIGLRGGYVEAEYDRFGVPGFRQFRAPWIRAFRSTHTHRVRIPPGGCWTLAWAGRREREWGFILLGRWIHWRRFHEIYDERGCP